MPAWLLPAIQAGAGLAQTIFGGGRARRAQRELEQMQTPVYQGSQSIQDYYNKALSRYSVNPYNSSLYTQQMRNIDRGQARGISALQDRRSGADVANLVQASNDASLNTAVAAEQQQGANLAQLGGAASALTEDKRTQFNINQMLPFERKSQLLGMKASGGNQIMNAGLSNLFGGIGGLSNAGIFDKKTTDPYIPFERTREVRPSTYQVPLIKY